MKDVERVLPMILLHELQENTLVDTGVCLEHQGGFALGMTWGVERLCLV